MEKEKRTRGITDVLLILVITILAGTVLILACGASPMEAYGLFFRGIFGTPAGFAEIFVKACPLILTGLGCAVAYGHTHRQPFGHCNHNQGYCHHKVLQGSFQCRKPVCKSVEG